MAVFQFHYEALLNIKIEMEKSEKHELAKKMRVYEKAEGIFQEMIQKREKILLRIQEMGDRIQIKELRDYSAFLMQLKNEIEKQKIIVKEAKGDVDKQREKLKKALKEKKTMEKLKEREMSAFTQKEQKKEQMRLDEIVNYNTRKKMNES